MAKALKTKKEARRLAIEIAKGNIELEEFRAEVEKLKRKRGIDKVEDNIAKARVELTNFMDGAQVGRLDLGELGYVNCIKATQEHIWISTKADIPTDAPEHARSLRSILGKEKWLKITKRVVDRKALEQMVDEGGISEDEIAPAHFERKRAAYVKFEKGV